MNKHLQVDIGGKRRVWAVMKNGERWEGDILVGADGIHSKVCTPEHYVYSCNAHHVAMHCDAGTLLRFAYTHQMQTLPARNVPALPNYSHISVCPCVVHIYRLMSTYAWANFFVNRCLPGG